MTDTDSMDDTLIDIHEERDNNAGRAKKLSNATIFELVRELCRRLWFCLRSRGRRILRIFGFKSVNDSDDGSLLEISREEQQIQRLNNDISNFKLRLEEQLSQIKDLHDEKQVATDRYMQEVQSLENEIENLKMKLRNAMNEKEELKRSKDDALSRLSELMGAKLRDNNPAITDLNDPNRPMKLGEQLSETYENDWTEAFINLQDMKSEDNDNKQITEEETIEILLNLLKEVNERSIAESSLQLSGILQSVQNLPKDETTDFMRKVKDSHKANAVQFVSLIYKKITSEDSDCKTVSKYISQCQSYVENCAKICYIAAVQDPPLYLDFKPGETFDRQIFKEYTKTGTKVRFLVWPALFLYRGGALLSKGVVQPLSESESA